MDLGSTSQDPKTTCAYKYVRPAKPWIYAWIAGVAPFFCWVEVYIYDNAPTFQFLLSIPVFAFYVYLIFVAFFGAARLEIDEECARRSLLGSSIVCIRWTDATVIQGFHVHRQGGGRVGAYRVLTTRQFLVFGQVFIVDETEVLAPKLNLIAKRFGIPLEQRTDFGKFVRVDAIRFG